MITTHDRAAPHHQSTYQRLTIIAGRFLQYCIKESFHQFNFVAFSRVAFVLFVIW